MWLRAQPRLPNTYVLLNAFGELSPVRYNFDCGLAVKEPNVRIVLTVPTLPNSKHQHICASKVASTFDGIDLHLTTTGEPVSGLRCAGNIDTLRLRLGLKRGVGDLMITLVVA